MQPGPEMYAAGQKLMQKARIDAAQARYSRPEWLQKVRIDAARARNVCSWPEKVAAGQDRCSPGQECMQLARNDCRRLG